MTNKRTLDTKVFVLSLYDYAMYDPSEHIVGFYSSQENAERQRIPMREAGLYLPDDDRDDDFHITPRTVRQIVTAAKKVNVESVPNDGYGEICFDGHNYVYPWAHCYMDPEEIFERLDKPANIQRFLPKQNRDKGPDEIDISGYDGWLRFRQAGVFINCRSC